jgi:hypothetical protein
LISSVAQAETSIFLKSIFVFQTDGVSKSISIEPTHPVCVNARNFLFSGIISCK